MPALLATVLGLTAWSLFVVIKPDMHVNLKNTVSEGIPVESGWMPPEVAASSIKPYFADYGKERIHEYLDACAANNVIPEIVWSFWFGDKPMSENRKRAADTMERILELPVILVTAENIDSFTKWPVNPNVKHLSGVHQSDYFRIYFVLHYGGYVPSLILDCTFLGLIQTLSITHTVGRISLPCLRIPKYGLLAYRSYIGAWL